MESRHQRQARRQFEYDHGEETTTVQVLELLDPDFGLYVWPSALVLAEYISYHLDMFTGTQGLPKTILELGAGTALPSLLLAKACSALPSFLIVTDRQEPRILTNIREALKENGIHRLYPEDPNAWVMVRGLNWGDFSMSNELNADGGLLQLLDDVSSIEQIRQSNNPGHIDLILGSDVFYNPPDFEPLLATVSYIINRHNPNCVFLTTYQNRSAKRNIDHLLEKWDLEGHIIDWEDFGFDLSKFVFADDDHHEVRSEANIGRQQSVKDHQGNATAETPMEDDDDLWLRQARVEVEHAMNNLPTVGTCSRHKVPLVDYSSGSGSESEPEGEMDTREDKSPEETQSPEVEQTTASGSSYRMGDGGSLNSVYLLRISKRGCGGRNEQR